MKLNKHKNDKNDNNDNDNNNKNNSSNSNDNNNDNNTIKIKIIHFLLLIILNFFIGRKMSGVTVIANWFTHVLSG